MAGNRTGTAPGPPTLRPSGIRGPALCGLVQVDNSVHNRWVSVMLPLHIANFDCVAGPACVRCAKLRTLKAER